MAYTQDTNPYTFTYVVQSSWSSAAHCMRYEVRNVLTDEVVYGTSRQDEAHYECARLNKYRG